MIRALITQRESLDQYGTRIDSLEAEYVEYFAELGIMVQPVSNYTKDIEAFAEESGCKMLILSGGGVVPAYGYDRALDRTPVTYRDRMEEALISWALSHDYPIIGICRGMQMLNTFFNGIVTKASEVPVKRAVREEHPVKLSGSAEILYVNHFHGDVIRSSDLGTDLIPLAIDELYDTVEAFRHKEKKIIGVQWHPERTLDTEEIKIYLKSLMNPII